MADELALAVYEGTRDFPKSELFGLTSQMRRAAVSVAANVVEGCGRPSEKDFLRFLGIAFGSIRELGYFIDLSTRLGYLSERNSDLMIELQSRTAAALSGLIASLK